ncbi:MAG: FAD-dependent oxidoreductase [Pseudomonadota bacterium]
MKIAVVGSGIAGLSAAWLLSKNHQVTIFEKFHHLGMDAHSIALNGEHDSARVDVPLRVFFDGFYPNLTALYQELGIESKPINYAASFGGLNDKTYFRYHNYQLGPFLLPFLKGRQSMGRHGLRIGWDLLRLFRQSPKSLALGISDGQTLEDYVQAHRYSTAFAEGFLYPAFSGICTCSHESIKAYPARVVLEYLNSGLLFSAVRRVTRGTREVVQLLAQHVDDVRLGAAVEYVSRTDHGVTVRTAEGSATFDHVVLATQANQTATILGDASTEEQALLASFSYEPSRVVVHKDTALAPPGNEAHWAPVNFVRASDGTTPMATIWMNAIQAMPDTSPVFQTWNPIIEPDPSLIIGEAAFERPIVNQASLQGLERLAQLHQQRNRRVWFCGSYAAHGIPLLESAAHSAFSVAERLGCRRPWDSTEQPGVEPILATDPT